MVSFALHTVHVHVYAFALAAVPGIEIVPLHFPPINHVQSTGSAELPLRAGSYAQHGLIRYSCIKAVHMSPALSRSSALQCFKHDDYATEECFISPWDYHTCRKIQPQSCVAKVQASYKTRFVN